MPNYKIVDADKLDADLTRVADAIRETAGAAERLAFPVGMIDAIKGRSSAPAINGYATLRMGQPFDIYALVEDTAWSTPVGLSCDKGDNPTVIGVEPVENDGYIRVFGLSEGVTILTFTYQYEYEIFDEIGDNAGFEMATRVLRYIIAVKQTDDTFEETINIKIGERTDFYARTSHENYMPEGAYFDTGAGTCTEVGNDGVIEWWYGDDFGDVTGLSEGTAILIVDYSPCIPPDLESTMGGYYGATVVYTINVTA